MISASQESESVLRRFSLAMKVAYKIFVAPRSLNWSEYSHKSIPYAFLIDAEGAFLWQGHPAQLSDRKIEQYLKERSEKIMEKFQGAPRASIGKFLSGQTADAYRTAIRAVQTEKNPEKKDATQKLADFLEKLGMEKLAQANKLFEQQEYLEAYQLHTSIQREWEYTEFAKKAKEKLKEYNTSEIKVGLEAAKTLERILQTSVGEKPSRKKLQEAAATLRQFAAIKKYAGTKAAEKAETLAEMYAGQGK